MFINIQFPGPYGTPVLCVPLFTAVCVMSQVAKPDVLKRCEVQKISNSMAREYSGDGRKLGFLGSYADSQSNCKCLVVTTTIKYFNIT